MNYSHIISDMTWSYSRITTYEECPYRFYLKYIRNVKGTHHFFADYGSFMHLIIQKYLIGELKRVEISDYYLMNFRKNVVCKAPNPKIFDNYFQQGLDYLANIEAPNEKILGVEKKVHFNLENRSFIGLIDGVFVNDRDGWISLVDNKSRNLKPRSTKRKRTKSDEELDRYLRQLYIYSIPIEHEYGVFPKSLIFNCFRTKTLIREPFDINAHNATKDWAIDTINMISSESTWNPNIDWFKCSYICDCNHQCEYFQMFGGDT